MLFFDELRVVMNRANSLAASFRSENAETLIPFVSWNVARDSALSAVVRSRVDRLPIR